jgi:hypothetical protein
MARGSGPALHRKACRLVDDDDIVVTVQHQALDEFFVVRPHLRRAFRRLRHGCGQRRHAHALAGRDPVACIRALAVEPDLPGAQELFQPAMTEFGEMPLEPAVEADFGVLGRHRQDLDAAHGGILAAQGSPIHMSCSA